MSAVAATARTATGMKWWIGRPGSEARRMRCGTGHLESVSSDRRCRYGRDRVDGQREQRHVDREVADELGHPEHRHGGQERETGRQSDQFRSRPGDEQQPEEHLGGARESDEGRLAHAQSTQDVERRVAVEQLGADASFGPSADA